MVEFAIVAFVLYLLLAAMLTFGRAIFVAQVLQQSADVFAHELARTPLPPGERLADVYAAAAPTPAEQQVRDSLFDERYLDVDISDWRANHADLTLPQYVQLKNWPLINRMLVPVMILDDRGSAAAPAEHLWYPGAQLGSNGHYYVHTLQGTGVAETPVLDWIDGNAPVGTADPMPLALAADGTTATGGLAEIHLNYAFQSASLSSFSHAGTVAYNTTDEPVDDGRTRGGLYGGPKALGQQYVAGQVVHPFQRLITAAAVYRREAYTP